MKSLIKIINSIAVYLLICAPSVFADTLGVNIISVVSPTTLEVEFSDNPNLRVGEVDGEVKVLQDISLRGSYLQESNKIEIMLEDPLIPNTQYSLLTIIGADGSIDFTSPNALDGAVIQNTDSIDDEDIESIEIINSSNIVVKYKQDIEKEEFEFKLLAESRVEKIENLDYFDGKILITLDPPFLSEKDYILMFIDLQDVDETYLEFDTGIYDFTTPIIEDIAVSISSNDSDTIIEDTLDIEHLSATEQNENMEVIQIEREAAPEQTVIPDLKAAGENISLQKNINEVAMGAVETPDTGAETWILILASLFINTIYHLSRRKKLSLA